MRQMGHTETEIKRNTTMMLYTNYNVNRIAVWALYYALKDEKVKQALLDEVQDFKKSTGKTSLFPSDVEQLPILGKLPVEMKQVRAIVTHFCVIIYNHTTTIS